MNKYMLVLMISFVLLINFGCGVEEIVTETKLKNPFDGESIELRDLVIRKDELYDPLNAPIGEADSIVVGPVHVLGHNVESQTFRVRPSLGTSFIDYDSDVGIEVYYGDSGSVSRCRQLRSDDRPIIYIKGFLIQYANSPDLYFYARDIAVVLEETSF